MLKVQHHKGTQFRPSYISIDDIEPATPADQGVVPTAVMLGINAQMRKHTKELLHIKNVGDAPWWW